MKTIKRISLFSIKRTGGYSALYSIFLIKNRGSKTYNTFQAFRCSKHNVCSANIEVDTYRGGGAGSGLID